MPKFSKKSLAQLATCHQDLQVLFREVIKTHDVIIITGHRGEKEQNAAYEKGNSRIRFPNGKHNSNPSMAVDACPFEPKINVDWKDSSRMHYFGGVILGIAIMLKEQGRITHRCRWGGDWNMNTQIKDEHFRDLCHFEIIA